MQSLFFRLAGKEPVSKVAGRGGARVQTYLQEFAVHVHWEVGFGMGGGGGLRVGGVGYRNVGTSPRGRRGGMKEGRKWGGERGRERKRREEGKERMRNGGRIGIE